MWFLNELSTVASVGESDSGLVRRARVSKVLNLLSNPIVVEIQAAGVERHATHEEVASAYLGLMPESKHLFVRFDYVDVVESSSSHIVVNAQLSTDCEFGDGKYSIRSPVLIDLVKGDDGLELSRIVDVSKLET